MTTTTATYYYSVNSPTDPRAQRMSQLRQHNFCFWEDEFSNQDMDKELVLTSLALSTGTSRQRINQLILAYGQLADLPQLRDLQHQLYHLDDTRLIAISNALFGLEPDNLAVVDVHLSDYLTPVAPNQALPTSYAIALKIEAIRDMLDDPKAKLSTDSDFHIGDGLHGGTELYASVDSVTGKVIKDTIAKHTAETGLSKKEAFLALILDKININVTLNIYNAKDLADAPVWASGLGWLDHETGHHWLDKVTKTQDMDEVMGKHLKGYAASPAMRAAVEGRDGGCSSPTCNVGPTHCDLDHRINHADGGCTCVENLCELCRRHHNGKTCERIQYLKDKVSGITIMVMEDGTWGVTVPEGPLTPQSARWAQTVSQYRTAHHQRWAAAANREAAQKETTTQQEVNDPPPF